MSGEMVDWQAQELPKKDCPVRAVSLDWFRSNNHSGVAGVT